MSWNLSCFRLIKLMWAILLSFLMWRLLVPTVYTSFLIFANIPINIRQHSPPGFLFQIHIVKSEQQSDCTGFLVQHRVLGKQHQMYNKKMFGAYLLKL